TVALREHRGLVFTLQHASRHTGETAETGSASRAAGNAVGGEPDVAGVEQHLAAAGHDGTGLPQVDAHDLAVDLREAHLFLPFRRLDGDHAHAVPLQGERLAATLTDGGAPRHVGDERLRELTLRAHEGV